MKSALLLLATLLVGLTTQAMPNATVPATDTSPPKYTFDSTTGALTLNWGEFNRYDNWDGDVMNTAVKSVTATSEVSFTDDCSQLFYNFNHCESMDLSRVNTSGMISANRMFRDCSSLTTLDLSNWNTANVTDMYEMFRYCESLISLDLSGWNTSKVTDMGLMFYYCMNLTSLDLSGWDTGNVIDMYHMFNSCESLASLDLSGWNTSKVSTMTQMFYDCRGLTSLDVSGWNTSGVMTMGGMFSGCSSLTLLDLSGWNTGNVIDMSNMFNGCEKLTSLDLSGFNTVKLENTQFMFSGCTGMTTLDISGWNTVNTWYMNDMFANCSSLRTIYAGADWTTGNVHGEWGEGMFTNCTVLVGGMGTAFDENHTDKTYARIDGGSSSPGYFTVKSDALRGDVNGDGEVNIADVNSVINIILGGGGNSEAADVNGDHEVNIADVNAVINIILGGTVPAQEHEWVDLGLPSGTLWATCNVGASAPEEYGNYFAWGETAPKDHYDWSTYKWCNGSDTTLTKYCIHSDLGADGFTDGKSDLEPEDDAAYVNWGPQWRMPTPSQLGELKDKCTWTWTTQNGVNGHLVTGPNGNSIFLPAAGGRYDSSLNNAGSHGYYWSRTLGSGGSSTARNQYFYSGGVYWGNGFRSGGQSVRAVRMAQN